MERYPDGPGPEIAKIPFSVLDILVIDPDPVIPIIRENSPYEPVFQVIPGFQHHLHRSRDDEADRGIPRPVFIFNHHQEGMPAIPGVAVIG